MADRYRAFVDPASGGQVAVSFDTNSDAIQHFHLVGSGGATIAGVDSLAGGPAVRVTPASSWSVTATGSVVATQGGAPWTTVTSVVGQPTMTASVPGQVMVTASVAGTPSVVASISGTPTIIGSVHATAVGSVQASQAGAWTFTGSVGATQLGAPWTTVASVVGQPTVTASIAGTPAIVGSVHATTVGSVAATQAGSWTVTANQGGAPWSQVGSVHVTQASTTQPFTVIVTSTAGGGSTVTGSVQASQVGSWGVLLYGGGTGIPAGVSSYGGDGHLLRVDVVRTSGSGGGDGAITDGADGTIKATVTSHTNASALHVIVDSTVGGGSTITGSVHVSNHLTVTASVIGQPTMTASVAGTPTIVGSVVATQGGAPWTTVASVVGTPTVVGSVGATQLGAPWSVVASVIGQPTMTASVVGQVSVTGSVHVTQANTTQPFTVIVTSTAGGGSTITGSVQASQVGSWGVLVYGGGTGIPAGVSSYGGDGHLLRVDVVRTSGSGGGDGAITDGADGTIKATVTSHANASALHVIVDSTIGGGSTITGSVWASQANTPWLTLVTSIEGPALAVTYRTIAANTVGVQHVLITDANSDIRLTVRSYAGGKPMAVALTDAAGAHLATVPVTGTLTGSVGATQLGAPWTTIASVVGQVTVTASISGVPAVVGSVAATQAGAPWTTVASVIGQPTVTASLVGTPTVTGSVQASQVGAWTFTGSVGATQLGAPWTTVASVAGVPTVQPFASATSAFTAVGSFFVTTSDRQVLANAPGTGARYYLTTLMATVASIASGVNILDGNTVIWRGYAAPNGGGFAVQFPMALRQPTANTSLGFQFITSGANGTVSVAGYVGT